MYNRNSYNRNYNGNDYGSEPYVVDIQRATLQNPNFRTAIWTGSHLQVTLMCIPVGGEIGLEVHPHVDQFLCIQDGCGCVMMGGSDTRLNYQSNVHSGSAVCVPAGTWHNIVNTGRCPIKLFSIYAPPQHPRGTIHRTKAESDAAEAKHQ